MVDRYHLHLFGQLLYWGQQALLSQLVSCADRKVSSEDRQEGEERYHLEMAVEKEGGVLADKPLEMAVEEEGGVVADQPLEITMSWRQVDNKRLPIAGAGKMVLLRIAQSQENLDEMNCKTH